MKNNVSGNALYKAIKLALDDKNITEKQKLKRIQFAIDLYKSMNE